MRALFILIFSIFTVSAAQADLVSDFKALDNLRKGPFTQNMLQGRSWRVMVLNPAPGPALFQAAFRNEAGQALVANYELYTANLFTTNYYELMGEYVYGNAFGNHPLDHQSLLNNSAQAMPKATAMVQDWVLEKYYVNQYPNSKIARTFARRGISGSEFEREYAVYFFDFYMMSLTDDFQFLPALLLLQGSPVTESSSLERARHLVSTDYDSLLNRWGKNTESVKRMWDLRNAIHNQLTPGVIDDINQYLKDFPAYQRSGYKNLLTIRSLLIEYYDASTEKIVELARAANRPKLESVATALLNNGPTTALLLELSSELAALKAEITETRQIQYGEGADLLVLINSTSQYLNMELSALDTVESTDTLVAALNVIYAEGYLIHDNYLFFKDELEGSSLAAAGVLLEDITAVAADTFFEAFNPSLQQWQTIEPGMQAFVDNKMKSSSLNTAALLSRKLNP